MDTNNREKLKVLANEGLIEFFGQDSLSQRLAEGLEKAVEELEEMNLKEWLLHDQAWFSS